MSEEDWLNLPRNEFLLRWYSECYQANAYGNSAGRLQSWMHRSLERGYTSETSFGNVLELGGNIGEHVPYIKHKSGLYTLTDITDNRTHVQRKYLCERGVNFRLEDACNLSFRDQTFDRVVHTCLLHHLQDPEQALIEMRRVLAKGGVADIFLSSDPGMIFRLARNLGPVTSARRAGLLKVKKLVDARDHLGHIGGIRRLIFHVFRDDFVTERVYPLNGASWNFSLWHTFRVERLI